MEDNARVLAEAMHGALSRLLRAGEQQELIRQEDLTDTGLQAAEEYVFAP